jgi:small subunit ribosomal protein S3
MGQKINPKYFRLKNGNPLSWSSLSVFDSGNGKKAQEFRKSVLSSINLYKYILKDKRNSFISNTKVDFLDSSSKVSIFSTRPGVLLGKKAEKIEELNHEISKIFKEDSSSIKIDIKESKVVENLSASIVASNIAIQIEKGLPYKKVIKSAAANVMTSALGIRISISGRLGGAEKASVFKVSEGSCALHTLKTNIDYCDTIAKMKYGVLGIKVLIARPNKAKKK